MTTGQFADNLVQAFSEAYIRQLAQRALESHGIDQDDDISQDVGLLLETVLRLIGKDWSEMLPD